MVEMIIFVNYFFIDKKYWKCKKMILKLNFNFFLSFRLLEMAVEDL